MRAECQRAHWAGMDAQAGSQSREAPCTPDAAPAHAFAPWPPPRTELASLGQMLGRYWAVALIGRGRSHSTSPV